MSTPFQRARTPEQIAARREAILTTARTLLAERPLADISLRELSKAVGLEKSNVLRYFDSREAIFLEILDAEFAAWLDELEGELPTAGDAREAAVLVADSIARHPTLCELISAIAGVLEKNISTEFALTYKTSQAGHAQRFVSLLRAALPDLDEPAAVRFSGMLFVLVAGLWPYSHPTPQVLAAMRALGEAPTAADFAANLREFTTSALLGASTY